VEDSNSSEDNSVSEFAPDENEDIENTPSRRATIPEFLEIIDYQPQRLGIVIIADMWKPYLSICFFLAIETSSAPIHQLLKWRSDVKHNQHATSFMALVNTHYTSVFLLRYLLFLGTENRSFCRSCSSHLGLAYRGAQRIPT
jgi:hypothetical protein